jgi:hypothetical protein
MFTTVSNLLHLLWLIYLHYYAWLRYTMLCYTTLIDLTSVLTLSFTTPHYYTLLYYTYLVSTLLQFAELTTSVTLLRLHLTITLWFALLHLPCLDFDLLARSTILHSPTSRPHYYTLPSRLHVPAIDMPITVPKFYWTGPHVMDMTIERKQVQPKLNKSIEQGLNLSGS